MIRSQTNCQQMQSMMFELDEAQPGLSKAERQRLEAHLQECEDCRNLREQEQRLTQLLKNSEPERLPAAFAPAILPRHRFSAVSVLSMVTLAVLVGALIGSLAQLKRSDPVANQPIVVDATDGSLGSIIQRPVIRHVSYRPEQQELESTNHIELPTGALATIELTDAGKVDAVGPAVFELDRVADGWKLTILEGQVSVIANGPDKIQVATKNGTTEAEGLQKMLFDVALSSALENHVRAITRQQEEKVDVAILHREAMKPFRESESGPNDMGEAASKLKQVMEHPDVSAEMKASAEVYCVAAFANAGMHEKALAVAREIQGRRGAGTHEMILYILGESCWKLGRQEEALQQWKAMLERNPETPFVPYIVMHAGDDFVRELGIRRPAGFRPNSFEPEAGVPFTSDLKSRHYNDDQKGYLVVQVGLDRNNAEHRLFARVAERAQQFHKGQLIEFDGENFAKLRQQIEEIKPENVLFVVPPQGLDVNLHRQIFKLAPTLDNDPFADFAWGYLTARDGDTVGEFWQRIEGLHQNGLANRQWLETAVLGGGMKSYINEGDNAISQAARAAGFSGKEMYFGCTPADPNVMSFVDKNLSELERASVIAMTGNGDPQGIWLFDDSRNADPGQHWGFHKDRVGQDADGQLTRIRAEQFRKLNLNSPVIWSGTCHSGACYRVFVESDIVSTFGSSDKTELYELPPDESFCLALIDAGAGSLLVPVASNHGMSVSMETDFLLTHGATLGQAIKSTYDDVYMQAGGVPPLQIVAEGDPLKSFGEPIMQGAGANRILIGDPALKLFSKTGVPHEASSVRPGDNGKSATITVEWDTAFHAWGWNIFADGRGGNRRIFSCIDCSQMPAIRAAGGRGPLNVQATIVDAEGNQVSCDAMAEVEMDGDRTWLHVQATSSDDDLMYQQHKATFKVSW